MEGRRTRTSLKHGDTDTEDSEGTKLGFGWQSAAGARLQPTRAAGTTKENFNELRCPLCLRVSVFEAWSVSSVTPVDPPAGRRIQSRSALYRYMATTILLIATMAVAQASGSGQTGKYAGRPVADVLRELQTAELRIIFSDDLVPAALRVKSEPTSRNAREIAEQILAPHGLTVQKGPRGTLIVVVRPKTPPRLTTPRPPTTREAPSVAEPPPAVPIPVRIEERVEVTDRLRETGAAAGTYTIEPSGVREMAGSFENVFQTLQVFPGAVGINDDDGKLAVRGGGPEHNLIVVDGVQIHRPQRLGHFTASFLNPDTIERVSLDASGLDARYGGRLSSVTMIETREGARDRSLAVSGSMGLTSGDVLFEGRLPKTETGSWWVTARGTYYRAVFDRLRCDETGRAEGTCYDY